MSAKLREYWEKLPKESLLATMLDPHLKVNPLFHQARASKTDASRLLKSRINLLKTHANLVADADPKPQTAKEETPTMTPRKRRDAWEEFLQATDSSERASGSNSVTSNILNISKEVEIYCNTAVVSDRRVKPLEWWKTHWEEYPTLSILARDWLAVPASSVPCESLFSIAGNTITANRNRLSPDTAKALLCLKSWWEFNKDWSIL